MYEARSTRTIAALPSARAMCSKTRSAYLKAKAADSATSGPTVRADLLILVCLEALQESDLSGLLLPWPWKGSERVGGSPKSARFAPAPQTLSNSGCALESRIEKPLLCGESTQGQARPASVEPRPSSIRKATTRRILSTDSRQTPSPIRNHRARFSS